MNSMGEVRWMCESVFVRSWDLGLAATLPDLPLPYEGEGPHVLVQRAILEYPDRGSAPWLFLDFGSPFGELRCRIESLAQRFKLLVAEEIGRSSASPRWSSAKAL